MPKSASELACEPGLSKIDRLLSAALCALVRPDHALLADTARTALANDIDPATVREACLQGVAYAGFPRALTALEAVHDLLPPSLPPASEPSDISERGRAHFAGVYGEYADRLLDKLGALHPVLAELTIDVAYGHILARPDIEPRTRELMGVAALSVLDLEKQMTAHAFGARRYGASTADVVEAARTAALLFDDVAARGHAELLRAVLG